MAVRRVKNQPALARLRAAHEARVRRTADKVRVGRLPIEEVAPDLRTFVDEELTRPRGGRR